MTNMIHFLKLLQSLIRESNNSLVDDKTIECSFNLGRILEIIQQEIEEEEEENDENEELYSKSNPLLKAIEEIS